jgi:hypothetical protein
MSKIKKQKHIEYPCDNCGKESVYNLQGDGWCLWSITKSGKFVKEKEWGMGDGNNNEFFCEKCAENEGII